jgi:hypothetical protein
VVGDEAVLVLGQQQAVAELGRRSRRALADGAGIRVRQRHQPIRNHPIPGQPLIGLGQQPLGGRDRLLKLAGQPPEPPIAGSAHKRPPGVARHYLHLLQGVPCDRRDLTGQPVHLGHRHPGAPPQRPSELLHPPPSGTTAVAEPGPAGRPAGLDPADQPTQLAHRVLQQVGVGRIVDVGLDHRGVHPQLAGPQQLAGGELGDQGGVQLLDHLRGRPGGPA